MKTIIRHTSDAILGISDRRKRRSHRAIVCLRAPCLLNGRPSTACRLTAMTAAPSG